MIESWKLFKIYKKRAMFFCPFHKSQKGSADLDVTIEGDYAGKYYCYGCGKSGSVPIEDVEKLRKMRGKIKETKPVEDWNKLNQKFIKDRFTSGVFPPLKVSIPVHAQLEWGFDKEVGAHTFPERDVDDTIIGILRVWPNNKGVVNGSRRGLTIPRIKFDSSKTLYITEGRSDLAVILECGLQGIARPNASTGDELITEWVWKNFYQPGFQRIVIVADNDNVGQEGAGKLSQAIYDSNALSSEIKTPPTNDLYDYYLEVGKERCREWLLE